MSHLVVAGSRYVNPHEQEEQRRQSFYQPPPPQGIERSTSNQSGLQHRRSTVRNSPLSEHRRSNTWTVEMSTIPFARYNDDHVVNPQDDYGTTSAQQPAEGLADNEERRSLSRAHRQQPLIDSPRRPSGSTQSPGSSVKRRMAAVKAKSEEEDPLLEGLGVVDRIEDEMENHTYEDLVPLEIKLALENQVFGWSHLTSSISGHVSFTVGAYALAYLIITRIYHEFIIRQQPGESFDAYDDNVWFRVVRYGLAAFVAFSTFRMVRRRRYIWFRAPYGSKEYQRDAVRRQQSVYETDHKTLLGRLMRRGNQILQRRVQKRLLKAHKMFQQRHKRQLQQRLRQEQEQFEEQKEAFTQQLAAEQQQQQATLSPSQQETINPEDVRNGAADEQNAGLLCNADTFCASPCDSFCVGDYSDENNIEPNLDLDYGYASPLSSESDFSDFSSLMTGTSPTNFNSLAKRKRRPSFNTNPTNKMESIMHDQILFRNGPILNMPYAHGGFFGAAPFMLANPHWIGILRHLMPDVYVEISRRVAYAPASKLIHWAENNPVVAAYGTAHELEYGSTEECQQGIPPNLEWDVFLDPWLVHQVEVVLQERDKFLSSILPPEHYGFYERQKPLGMSLQDWIDSINAVAEASSDTTERRAKIELTESQLHIAKYYGKQLQERAQVLVDKMLIAHGKLTHLIWELAGVAKRYNYSRVKRTRRTLGGGIYAQQWMAVYAEALKLGLYDDGEEIMSTTGEPVQPNVSSARSITSLNALAAATCPDMSMQDSVELVRTILKRRADDEMLDLDPVGILLDIKSRHINKRIWACVVDTLRAAGIRVVGLASFYIEEIRDISQYCSEPLMEVIFCHSAGDLQQACHNGLIHKGDKVFFNGGSLLWEGTPSASETFLTMGFDPDMAKRNYRILPWGCTRKQYDADRSPNRASPNSKPAMASSSAWMEGSTIELYKERYELNLGIYIQEFAVDETAADLVVTLVNENPHVYDLGLSWGGVNGITIRGIQPGRFTSTDGFWNQRYMGAKWDPNLWPVTAIDEPQSRRTMTPSSSFSSLARQEKIQ